MAEREDAAASPRTRMRRRKRHGEEEDAGTGGEAEDNCAAGGGVVVVDGGGPEGGAAGGSATKRRRRVRRDDDESENDDEDEDDGVDLDSLRLPVPLAPSLEAYLESGGHDTYAPRPEWFGSGGSRQRDDDEEEDDDGDREEGDGGEDSGAPAGDAEDAPVPAEQRAPEEMGRLWRAPPFAAAAAGGDDQDDDDNDNDEIRVHDDESDPSSSSSSEDEDDPTSPPAPPPATFGPEKDSALHVALKRRNPSAALRLIGAGADVDHANAKGITPLMSASQMGCAEVVRALLGRGAAPNAATMRGSTALIQACHFGMLEAAEALLGRGAAIDKANLKNTTALMRASQEGHEDVVRLLISHNANVNRRNDERMTALMLSSQRGHACIVRLLVRAGAQVDAKTAQDSTSLMLACKRKHLDVVRILVASGTELRLKDCRGRTVRENALRRGCPEFAAALTDEAQVSLMKEDCRRARNFEMMRMWRLLQSERATVRSGLGWRGELSIHQVDATGGSSDGGAAAPVIRRLCPSKRALVGAMTLPAPLIELVASFMPPPLILEKRLMLLTSRSHVDPNSAIFNALDLIDEVLEVGGLLQAFDAAKVTPPSDFESWSAFQKWSGKCDVILSKCADAADVANLFARESDTGDVDVIRANRGTVASNDLRHVEPSRTQRRRCNYLVVLSRAPPSLAATLSRPPYDMPNMLFKKLGTCQDMQSLVRRSTSGDVNFSSKNLSQLSVSGR